MATATCRTEDCENNGIPIDVGDLTFTDPVTGDVITSGVSCGPCGQPITDISDGTPEDPPTLEHH